MADLAPFVADCHVRLGVQLIAHTWDGVVLTLLRDGPARRGEMRVRIGGVSDKVVHESLRRLRDRGLVERLPGANGHYRLTTVGASFACGPLLELARWAEEHRDQLVAPDPS